MSDSPAKGARRGGRRTLAFAGRISAGWSEIDSERRGAILLICGIAVVVLLALGLVGYGYYVDRVKPRHDSVLKVGGRSFDYGYLERRALVENAQGRLDTSQLGQSILELIATIEREELVRQAAKSLGISATTQEIEDRLRGKLGVPDNAARDAFASRLRRELLQLDLSLAEYQDIARAEVLNNKLRAHFQAQVPAEAEQVDLRIIKLPTQAKAIEARDRIASGESIARVAADMSVDASQQTAGELGWVPRGALAPEVDSWAFANAGVSGIIEAKDGFYIVEARARETRPVASESRERVVGHQIADLLAKTREEKGSTSGLTNGQAQQLVRALGVPGA
jgi:parvulin-like peptidyl-prolyl isomerase